MTPLTNFLGTLTGPRRLRSALRRKTTPIHSLLAALDGPTELGATIPAAVFGGDIFGVMSSQLREALIVPPPPTPPVSNRQRKHSFPSGSNPVVKHSENLVTLADWLKQSTLPSEPLTAISKKTLSLNQNTTAQNSDVSSLGPQASRLPGTATGFLRYQAGETPAVPGKSTTELPASSTAKRFPTVAPTLVNSLNRYWASTSARQSTSHTATERPVTESLANPVDFPVTEPEQRTVSSPWPTSVGRDVSQKLRSFADVNHPLKSRLSSAPDGRIQNVFNIEVNEANHQSSSFDDLGDRLAQILHEQALQHGIDVT